MHGLKIAVGLVAALAIAPAHAETLKFLTNQNGQTITPGTEMILNGENGATSVKIKLEKKTLVVVTFTASCIASGSNGSGVTVQILVKLQGQGTTKRLPPSNDLPLCRVGPSGSVWETTSVVGGMEMPAGTHKISVGATTLNFATASVGATALQIEN